jgi:hypothetical protein
MPCGVNVFLIHGDARYRRSERIIYGFLSASASRRPYSPSSVGPDSTPLSIRLVPDRCPTNIVRSCPPGGYAYAPGRHSHSSIFFGSTVLDRGGNTVRLIQDTEYPWGRNVRIEVEPERHGEFAIHIRIPNWARTSRAQRPVPLRNARPEVELDVAAAVQPK